MSFELHIWGPAFGLESIDPECLAAVAYLRLAAPQPGVWSVVPTSASAIPHALPALRNATTGRWVATGFDAIVAFAKTAPATFADLDAGLSPRQVADAAAFSAFLRAEAAPLIALSLYVSSANWVATTRPAYSRILPFPLTWIEPPAIREAHAAATAHLGFSSLDTDRTEDDRQDSSLVAALNSFPERLRSTVGQGGENTSTTTTEKAPPKQASLSSIPGSAHGNNKTLAAVLKSSSRVSQALTPEAKARIRLDNAACACYAVLAQQKGERKLFLTDTDADVAAAAPTSLDCLAYAYLSLMVVPDVPRPFLADSLSRHHPGLADFVSDMQQMCFGAPHNTRADDGASNVAVATTTTTTASKPLYVNPLWLRTVHGLVHSIPGLGGEWMVWLWRRIRLDAQDDDEDDEEEDDGPYRQALQPWRRSAAGARRRQVLTIAGTLASTALLVGLVLAYHRLPAFGARTVVYRRPQSALLGLGAAGAFLHAAF